MEKVTVKLDIDDDTYDKLYKIDNDIPKLVVKVLQDYVIQNTNPNDGDVEMLLWQKHIEQKVVDLQLQIDRLRTSSASTDSIFDSDLSNRNAGNKDPMDLGSGALIRVSNYTQSKESATPAKWKTGKGSKIDQSNEFDLNI